MKGFEAPGKGAVPWHWFAEMGPWLESLSQLAGTWESSVELSVDNSVIAELISTSAEAEAPWLYHPCLGGITHACQVGRAERDAVLLGWLALHTELDGELVLSKPMWCWSREGGFRLEAGAHYLSTVGNSIAGKVNGGEIALDPWCTVLGYAYPDSWSANPSQEEQRAGVHRGATIALRSLALLRAYMPDAADWLAKFTRLLIFLDGDGNLLRSSSSDDLPGIVFADATSEIGLLEVLVHESAHHLLYITEAGGPLIDPAEKRTFASPLRPDPRPLRGILLAYHALVFICAFYRDLWHSELGGEIINQSDLASLHEKMSTAGKTLDSASNSLTDRGRTFLDTAHEMACYAI